MEPKECPLHYSVPVPVAADFGVTGLIRHGQWSDRADLEAARKLLESRFDLRIGIWDLVDNPTLRTSLLTVEAPKKVVKRRRVEVLTQARQRAQKEVATRTASKRADAESKAKVMDALAPLIETGWERLDRYGYYRYPLSSVERWPNEPKEALGWLALDVVRRSTKVVLRTVVYNDVKIDEFFAAREATFEAIAIPHGCSLSAMWPVLLDLPGGLGDNVDFGERRQEIANRVPRWIDALSPLFDQALAVVKERKANSSPLVASLTITIGLDGKIVVNEGQPPTRRTRPEPPPVTTSTTEPAPKKGWLKKLLGD